MKVIDRFTTQDGLWDVDASKKLGIDQAHRDKYADNPAKGAANHIHVKAAPGTVIKFNTSDGKNPVEFMTGPSGWVNLGITHDASYNPDTGAVGPWGVWANGEQVASGIGLPYGWHVATFLVLGDGDAPTPTLPPLVVTGDAVEARELVAWARDLLDKALDRWPEEKP